MHGAFKFLFHGRDLGVAKLVGNVVVGIVTFLRFIFTVTIGIIERSQILGDAFRVVVATSGRPVGDDGRDFVLNSITATKDKRLLKMNIFYIKEEGRPVGALVLNMEMDFFLRMSSFLNERLMTEKEGDSVYLSGMPSDLRARRAEGLDAIDSVIRSFGPSAEKMTPSERKEVFIDIYDTGVFKLKGAIPRAAEALKVSEKTIYRYLSEIKKGR